MRTRWIPTILVLVAIPSCSKDTDIDASQTVEGEIGLQCSGRDDPACGTAGVCVLGYCRTGCATDAECPTGSLCVGDTPPFGCQLAAEIDCSEGQACAPYFACGPDGKCRMPCGGGLACPRNEHICIGGVCLGNEPARRGAESCVTPDIQNMQHVDCESGGVSTCNVFGWGWSSSTTPCHGRCMTFCTDFLASGSGPVITLDACIAGTQGDPRGCGQCASERTACQLDPACVACAAVGLGCEPNPAYEALTACAASCPPTSEPMPECP
jgi:hypothetical protein